MIQNYLLTLPVCPPLNHQKTVVHGRMVKSKEDRIYAKTVQNICWRDRVKPFAGDVEVKIKWFRARKAGDIDRFKTLLDALQGFAYQNDSQIKKLVIERSDDDKLNPRLEVMIEGFK